MFEPDTPSAEPPSPEPAVKLGRLLLLIVVAVVMSGVVLLVWDPVRLADMLEARQQVLAKEQDEDEAARRLDERHREQTAREKATQAQAAPPAQPAQPPTLLVAPPPTPQPPPLEELTPRDLMQPRAPFVPARRTPQ